MSFLDGSIASSDVISCMYASCVCVCVSFLVPMRAIGLCGMKWRRLHQLNTGPLREHVGGVQSLKPMVNPHWLLDYPSIGFSMVSSRALNSPIHSKHHFTCEENRGKIMQPQNRIHV